MQSKRPVGRPFAPALAAPASPADPTNPDEPLSTLSVPQLRDLRAHAVSRIDDIDAALRGHGADPPESPLSRPALARLFGVEESVIGQWEKDGVPAIRTKGAPIAYHGPVVIAWWRTREAERVAREAEQAWSVAVKATQAALLALPASLAAKCIEAAPEGPIVVRRVLSEGIRGALRALAAWTGEPVTPDAEGGPR